MEEDSEIFKSQEYEYVLRKNMLLHLDLDDRDTIATIAMMYKDKISHLGKFVEDDKLLIEVIKEYIRKYKTITYEDLEDLGLDDLNDTDKDYVFTSSELKYTEKDVRSKFDSELKSKSDRKLASHGGHQYNDSYDDKGYDEKENDFTL